MTVPPLKSLLRNVKADSRKPLVSAECLRSLPERSAPLQGSDCDLKMGLASGLGIKGVTVVKLFEAIEAMSESFVRLRGRKCICLGGSVTCAGLVEQDNIPDWLSGLMRSVGKLFPAETGLLSSPNHALINVYEPGEGIMAHEDGPAYSPYAAILSLGSSTVFDFVPKTDGGDSRRRARVYLPVGSLLLFTGEAYKDMLHEVRFARHDYISEGGCLNGERIEGCGFSSYSNGILTRGKRISITMRHVEVSR